MNNIFADQSCSIVPKSDSSNVMNSPKINPDTSPKQGLEVAALMGQHQNLSQENSADQTMTNEDAANSQINQQQNSQMSKRDEEIESVEESENSSGQVIDCVVGTDGQNFDENCQQKNINSQA